MSEEKKNLKETEEPEEELEEGLEEELEETDEPDDEDFDITKAIKSGRKPREPKIPFNTRKLKRGGFAAAFTLMFVAFAVLVNVLFNTALSRFDVRLDFTERALYSIESSTREYLTSVDDTVNIYICSDETLFRTRYDIFYDQVAEIAERFTEANSRFTLSYVDRLADPMFSARYGGGLNDTDIVIESENTGRYRVVPESEYIDVKYYYEGMQLSYDEAWYYSEFGMPVTQTVDSAAEIAFLSAIMSVTDLTPIRVAFTHGYGEGIEEGAGDYNVYSAVADALTRNSYIIESVNLLTASVIDPELDFLVLFAPTADYTLDVLDRIDLWIDNGGELGKHLIYIPTTLGDVRDMPNLEAYLAEWGVAVEKAFIFQANSQFVLAGNSDNFEQYMGTYEAFGEGVNVTTPLVGAYMRPVSVLFEENRGYYTLPVITGYDGTIAYPLDLPEEEMEAYEPVVEELHAGVLSEKTRYENNEYLVSSLLVIGSPYFFHPMYLSSDNLSNSTFLLNIFNDLSGRDESFVYLMPKSYDMTRFAITQEQANMIALTFVVIMPLLIIIAGLVVFFRRRYR